MTVYSVNSASTSGISTTDSQLGGTNDTAQMPAMRKLANPRPNRPSSGALSIPLHSGPLGAYGKGPRESRNARKGASNGNEDIAMLGICVDCHKPKNTHLPSGYDSEWLNHQHPSIDWRCESCHWKKMAEITNRPIEINIHRHYLMPVNRVIPFLASIAFIIMVCLEIAVHS